MLMTLVRGLKCWDDGHLAWKRRSDSDLGPLEGDALVSD